MEAPSVKTEWSVGGWGEISIDISEQLNSIRHLELNTGPIQDVLK